MNGKFELPKVYRITFHRPECADARCDGCMGRRPILRVRGVRREKRS